MYYRIENNYPVISPILLEGFIQYDEANKPQELKDAEAVQVQVQAQEQAKQAKELALSQITVTTTNGNVFDGREKDVVMMGGAIQASEVLGLTSHQWKLHDNSVEVVTLAELKEALALSMQAIGSLKIGGN